MALRDTSKHDDLVAQVAQDLGLTHAHLLSRSFSLASLPVPWIRLPDATSHLRRRPDGARVDAAARTLLLVEVDLTTCSYSDRRWSYSVAACLLPEWRVSLLTANEYSRTELPLDGAARDYVNGLLAEHRRSLARFDAAFGTAVAS